jgi:hypothetical protein
MIIPLESKVTPFGGLHLIHKQLSSKKFAQFIDQQLGQRVKTVGYNYSELLLTRFYTTLCGGSATEDVNYIREHTLEQLKGFRVPSADTILRGDCELASDCELITTDSGKENKVNINSKMNDFMISCAKFFNILPQEDLIYDFDHEFIPTEKYDATYSYKKEKGYFPAVVSIADLPLYIEGRNGNCNVKTAQLDTHKRALEALHQQELYPTYARMDAGSYIQEVTDFFHSKQILFFIRANQSQCLLEAASKSEQWQQCTIGYQDMHTTTIAYQFGNAAHRIVAYRVPNKTGQVNTFTGDAYKYMFIITNDWQMSDQQVIEFYNKRGASEKVFDIQNNDFNWTCMPHSFLEENTVYLIIMAIAHIIYKWLIKSFSKCVEGLKPNARLKQFIFRFVNIVAKITRSGRQQIIALATKNQSLLKFANAP